ncbi:MAG: hypothetical protein JNM90_02630 [Burkholderiales bacterium]|nr:hypothetical protein [Burkholderiales bacterium]
MSESEVTGERFMRFHALYREVVKSEFDALEFAEDDLYAFQVLDRAFRSDNQELRNLAAHLQTQREAALETITLRASEINESTRKLKTLELKVLERAGLSGDLPPGGAAQDEAPESGALPGREAPRADAPAAESGNRGRRKGWLS